MSSPKKSLSQNFLHDQTIIQKIVHSMNIQEEDFVLEIGAGRGALTKEIAQTNVKIVALEIDNALICHLQKLEEKFPNLTVYNEDFLLFDFDKISPSSSTKLVSNLPYHLTGTFLKKICLMHHMFSTATLMVQKEVAERICSTSGKKYGFLSVFVQFFADIRYLGEVPRKCFYPKPNVDSSIIQLTFKTPISKNPELFFSFVKKCFQGKRKQLLNCLKPYFDPAIVKKGLIDLELDEHIRAERLSQHEFLALHDLLKNSRFTQ